MPRSTTLLSLLTAALAVSAMPLNAHATCLAQGTWTAAFSNLLAGAPVPDFTGASDACVRAAPDVCVGFDETTPVHLDSLRVEGKFRFNDTGDRTLNAHKIIVADGGTFRVGTQPNRFSHEANIELTDGNSCDASGTGAGEYVIENDGSGGLQVRHVASPTMTDFHPDDSMAGLAEPNRSLLVLAGAKLQLHGAERSTTWTTLSATTNGTTGIDVQAADDWVSGDEVVVASTDFDMDQTERRWIDNVTVTAGVDTVTLTTPLAREHWSGLVGSSVAGFPDVEVAGEVALLTHNVRVYSPDWYTSGHLYDECGNDDLFWEGAEIRITSHMGSAPLVEIENIEVYNAGKYDSMGHYPIHFHHTGQSPGSYVRGVSVHKSSNRAIVLHGAQGIEVADNVVYEIAGHAYYLERSDDYDTKHNTLRANLGLNVRNCNPLDTTDPEGALSKGAAVFYFEDPRNSFVDNVAAGSEFAGFYFAQASAIHSVETGAPLDASYMCGDAAIDYSAADPGMALDTSEFSYANAWYDDTQYESWGYAQPNTSVWCEGAFVGNTVHTTQNGFYANEHRKTFMRILDLTAYKNHQRATMIKNKGATEMVRLMASDNGSAVWPASHAYHNWGAPSYLLIDSHIVGESANVGDNFAPGDESTAMRSLPNDTADYDIHGVEVYEGRVHVTDTYLELFVPNYGIFPDRAVAAFGRHRSFPFYTNNVDNSVRNVTLDAASQPLFFEDPDLRENGDQVDYAAGYVSVMLNDLDGSLTPTGQPATIVAAHDFIVPGQLSSLPGYVSAPPDWNAYVISPSDLRYGQVVVRWCDTSLPLECSAYAGGGVLTPSKYWTQEKQGTGWFGLVEGMEVLDATDGDLVQADHSPDGLHTRLGANLIAGHDYAVDFWANDSPVTLLDAAAGELADIEAMEVHYRFAPVGTATTLSMPVPGQPQEVHLIYGDDPSVALLPTTDVSPADPAASDEWRYEGSATERRVHLYLEPAAKRESVVILMGFR